MFHGGNIRSVIFKKSGSLSATLQIKRDISQVYFKNSQDYKKQPTKRQDVIDNIVDFAEVAGLDAGGAEIAEVSGPLHSGGNDSDRFSRVTTVIKDRNGNRLYFYRSTDGKFWDRIHVPEHKNQPEWPSGQIYHVISKADFEASNKPAGL